MVHGSWFRVRGSAPPFSLRSLHTRHSPLEIRDSPCALAEDHVGRRWFAGRLTRAGPEKGPIGKTVVGLVRRQASVAGVRGLGAVDLATCDLRAAVRGAGLVVLCTPLAQMRPLVEQMLPVLEPGAVVTDVGSVKGPVVEGLEGLVAQAGGHFIGGHPMAGTEQTGVASRAGRPLCGGRLRPDSHRPLASAGLAPGPSALGIPGRAGPGVDAPSPR